MKYDISTNRTSIMDQRINVTNSYSSYKDIMMRIMILVMNLLIWISLGGKMDIILGQTLYMICIISTKI